MRFFTTAILALTIACGFTTAARADYFFWRDAKTGLSLSFPDTWRMVSGLQPDDVITIMAPSGRANAQCRVRVDSDRRFMIYPPRYAPQIQKLNLGADFWNDYLKTYNDDQPYNLEDGAGLGRGYAGYAEASYVSAVPGPKMPRRGVLFATIYFGKLYVLDCSAHRDAFAQWVYPFLDIAKSVDFKPAYHTLTTGNYRNFEVDPRIQFWNHKDKPAEVY